MDTTIITFDLPTLRNDCTLTGLLADAAAVVDAAWAAASVAPNNAVSLDCVPRHLLGLCEGSFGKRGLRPFHGMQPALTTFPNWCALLEHGQSLVLREVGGGDLGEPHFAPDGSPEDKGIPPGIWVRLGADWDMSGHAIAFHPAREVTREELAKLAKVHLRAFTR